MRSLSRLATMAGIAVSLGGGVYGFEAYVPGRPVLTATADPRIDTTFTTFDPHGSKLTLPTDINARGQIVGRYLGADGRTHGFLREKDGTITTIDIRGANFTVAGSINNSGTIVGWYTLPSDPTRRHGFKMEGGDTTTFDAGSTFTNALGISENGDIVGRFCGSTNCPPAFQGFLYRAGALTVLSVTGASETDAFKEQANGTIVGGFSQRVAQKLFTYRDGRFTTFALPNGRNIALSNGGTNARGDIVGTYCDQPGSCMIGPPTTHGFLLRNGRLTRIDVPHSNGTSALGINEQGDIVGNYNDAYGQARGFLLTH